MMGNIEVHPLPLKIEGDIKKTNRLMLYKEVRTVVKFVRNARAVQCEDKTQSFYFEI